MSARVLERLITMLRTKLFPDHQFQSASHKLLGESDLKPDMNDTANCRPNNVNFRQL